MHPDTEPCIRLLYLKRSAAEQASRCDVIYSTQLLAAVGVNDCKGVFAQLSHVASESCHICERTRTSIELEGKAV